MSKRNNTEKTSKKHRFRPLLIVVCILLITLLALIAGIGIYTATTLDSVKKVEIKQDPVSVGIDPNMEFDDSITNIAFLGVDSRNHDVGRSDATMVLTIDNKHRKVKLTSLYRDSYVNVEGYGMTKLNHAYAYGGPQLAIKTINSNFGLDIKDFVKVDFGQLVDVIDTLGGVDITIKDYELNSVNKTAKRVAKQVGKPFTPVEVGPQTLTGVQAVGYSRVRYAGNGDIERTQRQRNVINAIFDKIKNAGPTEYPNIVSSLLPLVDTSLSSYDIITMGMRFLTHGIDSLEMYHFPLEDKAQGQMINGVWYWVFDIEENKNYIRNYIYNDIIPE